MSSFTVSTWMSRPSGSTTNSFGCLSSSASRQSRHSPQPPSRHRSAAANARAASDLPPPSGPASRYAWCGRAAAWRRNAIARSWPGTRSSTSAGVVVLLLAILQDAFEGLEDLLVHLLGSVIGVDHHEALRMLLGDLQVGVGDPAVELAALHLDPIGFLRRAQEPGLGLEVQQDGQVREQPLRRPHVERQHVLLAETARRPLVRERRVDVAVADHDLALAEGRADQRRNVLRASRREQQRLGPRLHVAGVVVQQQFAQLLTHDRASGLARDEDVDPPRLEVLRGQADLRALAGALDALEGDEQPCRRRTLQLGHEREGLGLADPEPREAPAGDQSGDDDHRPGHPERHAGAGQVDALTAQEDLMRAHDTREDGEGGKREEQRQPREHRRPRMCGLGTRPRRSPNRT